MTKRPCLICGTPTTGSRCPSHALRRNKHLSDAHLDGVYLRDGAKCQLCGEPVTRRDATLDHVVSLADGGSDHPSNLRLAHRSCNSSRGPGERIRRAGEGAG